MNPRRPLVLLLVLVLAAGATACGSEEPTRSGEQAGEAIGQAQSEAETEGIYVDLGGLKYQVQVSRQLNPALVADRAYFDGIPAGERALPEDELWFGVFLRAANHMDEPMPAARRFEVHDTQENVYVPIGLGPENPFAWTPRDVRPNELIPDIDSAAGERAPNGALLIFRLKRFSFDNRPLEFIIFSPTGDGRATVNLDV